MIQVEQALRGHEVLMHKRDLVPVRLLRMVLSGRGEQLFRSTTIYRCHTNIAIELGAEPTRCDHGAAMRRKTGLGAPAYSLGQLGCVRVQPPQQRDRGLPDS